LAGSATVNAAHSGPAESHGGFYVCANVELRRLLAAQAKLGADEC